MKSKSWAIPVILIFIGIGAVVYYSKSKLPARPKLESTITTPLPESRLDDKNLPETKSKSDSSYMYITSDQNLPFSLKLPDGRLIDETHKSFEGIIFELTGPLGNDEDKSDQPAGSTWELDYAHPISGTYTLVFFPAKTGTYTPSIYVVGADGKDADLEKTITAESGVPMTFTLEYNSEKIRSSKLLSPD